MELCGVKSKQNIITKKNKILPNIKRYKKNEININLDEKVINKLISKNYVILQNDDVILTTEAEQLISFYEGSLKYES